MELVKISELPIKEITTIDAYMPIIDNVGEDIENYRISLLNLFKTGGIINVNRTYGDANYTLPTALAVIEPTLLTNGVFITFKGMDGWELYQKELNNYVKYLNRIDDELETDSQNPLTNDAITRMYNELLATINSIVIITNHKDLENKNAEPEFQHVDTTITKETLVEVDKVAIFDSVTGKVVLTDKTNVGGITDIISTNVTNNTGTIVIDTTPNWQRVNITSGVNTLVLDYENGILPTKNREYLLVINNAHTATKILTLPTVSFVKGGITYNFMNTTGSFPINSGKSIEVNVVFFFIDTTTCNIRTLISPFI